MKHLIKLLEQLAEHLSNNKLRQLLILLTLVLFMPCTANAITLGNLSPDINLPSLTEFKAASPIPNKLSAIQLVKPNKKQMIVRLYTKAKCPACDILKSQLSCVPQIKFVEKPVEDWVTSFPVIQWQGDNGQWWSMGNHGEGVDLQAFVEEYNGTNPSQIQVAFDVLEAKDIGYPIRGSYWSVGSNWRPSKSEVIYHLLYSGQHAGKFTKSYLDQLSWNELQSLHSDDHESRVKWASVEKTGPVVTTKKTTIATGSYYQQYTKPRRKFRVSRRSRGGCPGGSCPL